MENIQIIFAPEDLQRYIDNAVEKAFVVFFAKYNIPLEVNALKRVKGKKMFEFFRDDTDASVRLVNLIHDLFFEGDLEDFLKEYPISKLSGLRGFGKKSCDEFKNIITERGYKINNYQ
jgi:hypothetical protein